MMTFYFTVGLKCNRAEARYGTHTHTHCAAIVVVIVFTPTQTLCTICTERHKGVQIEQCLNLKGSDCIFHKILYYQISSKSIQVFTRSMQTDGQTKQF